MESPSPDLVNLERLRAQLEDQIAALRKSLKRWQTREFEYEALKEEFRIFKATPSDTEIVTLAKSFNGKAVDEKELKDIAGLTTGMRRLPDQILRVLQTRQDDTRRNVDSLERQLGYAEQKLGSLKGVKEEFEDEAGLPLMEIREELDEDDNMISGTVEAPRTAAAQVAEALGKVGLNLGDIDGELPTSRSTGIQRIASDKNANKQTKVVENSESSESLPKTESVAPVGPKAAHTPKDTEEDEEIDPTFSDQKNAAILESGTPARKKSVSFANDTKEDDSRKLPATLPERRKPDPNIAKGFFTTDTSGHSRVIELDEEDRAIGSMPITPYTNAEDTPEEAQMRREMLQYSLQEVGAVVAEIDLEEGDYSDYDDEDDLYEEDEDDDVDVDTDMENEDEFGRSTLPGITPEYRRRMLDLEAKLNARMVQNVGPRPDAEALTDVENEAEINKLANSAHRLKVMKAQPDAEMLDADAGQDTKPAQSASSKKGVRFAEELDISTASARSEAAAPQPSKQPPAPPLSSSIVERSSPVAPTTSKDADADGKPKKVSRFKSARAGAGEAAIARPDSAPKPPSPAPVTTTTPMPEVSRQRLTPSGPKGAILSTSVIEHDIIPNSASEPDEFDPELLRRQVEAEYHKQRNTKISRQGGFLKDDSDEEETLGDLYEEKEDGQVRKVSRFRAARLKAQGY